MDIIHVVGARPNFMKVAPVMRAMDGISSFSQTLVHTGQHYDANMSEVFFKQLDLVEPDISLNVGSGSHAQQTAQIMMRFEEMILQRKPDLVLVYGDVNSTVAAALVCAKLGIRIGHVEAGLRSFDRRMPEEINRLLTDQISDLLFTPSEDGNTNLMKEGIEPDKVFLVGNVMIDTMVRLRTKAREFWPSLQQRFGLDRFGLVTLHRPSNVDDTMMLQKILATLNDVSAELPLLFPIHPRTFQKIKQDGLLSLTANIMITEPLGYLEFLSLQEHAQVVLTDSGGIQEETTFLQIPCITLRENTERPITVTMGSNVLVGQNMDLLRSELEKMICQGKKPTGVPSLWDGKASERIADCINSLF